MKRPVSIPGKRDSHAHFDTTRWSLIAMVGSEHSQEARDALDGLCRAYWLPIYAEIRRRGHAAADAQDLTQDFLLRLLRRDAFGKVDCLKGRFRTYLLGSLDYFLVDQWRARNTLKRGGGAPNQLFMDHDDGERWFQEQPTHGLTPAEVFDQNWAVVLMDRALKTLRQDYHDSGREKIFRAIEPFLTADSGAEGYAQVCDQIGLTPQAFAVAVHRMRKRFRHCVRSQVEATVADPSEVDAEMQHLFGVRVE